ncbi:hypothetical protein [Hydrotalea sp.]|uniref:hypothetical protein n=1 Tax=Hydrotalea sp. TaxID=2881279 RepID=UPI00260AAF4F|nr:hypothetical protein [Hydrotalea sp.]
MNKVFYHQTVTTAQIENYINQYAGFNYQYVFSQYLRTTQIPVFEYAVDSMKHSIRYRWSNCLSQFNLPLSLWNENGMQIKIYPTTQWKIITVQQNQIGLFNQTLIERLYYVQTKLLCYNH